MRLLYVITDLDIGGAETQLVQLAKQFTAQNHQVHVVSMLPPQAFVGELGAKGVEVSSLNMRRGFPDPRGILRLTKIINKWRPHIVNSHMVHANLLVRITRLVTPMPILVCTAHSTVEGGRWRELAYRLTDRLCDLTTHVSEAGAKRAVRVGAVPMNKVSVIPNGVDTKRFRPDPQARDRLRQELGLHEEFAWLAIGRFEKVKDYPTMLNGFAGARAEIKHIVLLIAGQGPLEDTCRKLAIDLGLENSVRFLGRREDVPALMNAADGYLMSSLWEGLPMVLLEAAASGLPSVATDVGGNSDVVSADLGGRLVPAGSPGALREAMLELMALPLEVRHQTGRIVRARVEQYFSLDVIVNMWQALYTNLMKAKGADL